MNLYAGPAGEDLSIGELSQRTGVGISTLRAWETRYGFPTPRRRASGHRRYSHRDAELILAALRLRRAGATLESALTSAKAVVRAAQDSIMATLRDAMPDVPAMVLTKRGMLAVSRAIEDEAAARANGALLIGAFQQAQFWRGSARRWSALARSADTAIALGAPKRSQRGVLWHVPIAATAPVSREWAVICDAPDYVACLVGVELPPRDGHDDVRRFEALWTVEPRAVREAARTGLVIAAEIVPEIEAVTTQRLAQPGPPPHVSTRHAIALANRIVTNYDGLLRR